MSAHPLPRYRDWLNLTSRLLWCYDEVVMRRPAPPGPGVVPLYNHNSAWLVRRGWAEVEEAGGRVRAEAGEWLIVRPGRIDQHFEPGTEILSVAFDVHWPDGAPWLDEGLSLVIDAATAPQLERRAKPMARLMARVDSPFFDLRDYRFGHRDFLRLQSLLMQFISELVDVLAVRGVEPMHRDPTDERVVTARRLVESLPPAGPLDVAAIAAQVGLSPVHLQRLFHDAFDCTLKRYFDHLRLTHAQRRLAQPDTLVKEVGIELGFTHQAHFTRWYRRLTGHAPTRRRV